MTSVRGAVDELMADWAWHLDHGEFDGLVELFTADAVLVTGRRQVVGRDAIRARYADRAGSRTTRHVYSGLRVEERPDGSVAATTVWVCYASNRPDPADDLGVYLVADFHDVLRREADGAWRLAQRRIEAVLRDPSRAPVSA